MLNPRFRKRFKDSKVHVTVSKISPHRFKTAPLFQPLPAPPDLSRLPASFLATEDDSHPIQPPSSPPPPTTPFESSRFDAPEITATRICSKLRCPSKLPPNYRFKMCEECRTISREMNRKRKDRIQMFRDSLSSEQRTRVPSSDDTMASVPENVNLPIEMRLKTWMGKLREAGKLPLEPLENGVEHYAEDEADRKRKASGEYGAGGAKKMKIDRALDEEEKFQSQADLCSALGRYVRRLITVTSVGDFVGSYTIVAAEEEEITEKMVREVAKNIIGDSNLPVTMVDPPTQRSRMRGGRMASRWEYRCACSDRPSSGESNMCGGAIGVEIRHTSLQLSKLEHVHGHRLIVKVVHDPE